MSGWTLTNYWLLLVWLAACGLFFGILIPKRSTYIMGQKEYRWSVPCAVITAIPYIVWTANRHNFGDTEVYRGTFKDMPKITGIASYLDDNTKDQGFSILVSLIKTIIGNHDIIFFAIIAAFQILCVVLTYRKYSWNFWLSMFLFIASTDYISWTFNGIRQFIAAAGIFACMGLIIHKKFVPLFIIILILATIHGTAIIMIPIILIAYGRAWNKRTLIFMLLILVAVAFVGQFTDLLNDAIQNTQYSDVTTNGIWSSDNGTSWIRVAVYSVPALLSLLGKRYVDEADSPVINLCVNMSIMSAGFYILSGVTSGIYIGRIPIYMSLFSYILLPWLIDHMFTKSSARVIKILMVLGYLGFFYYQMHITWKIL